MLTDSRTSTSSGDVHNKNGLQLEPENPRRRSVRFSLALIMLLIVSVVMAMASRPARATAGGDFGVSQFFLPRLHVHKGLPFGIDIGGSIAAIPETDFQVIGAEVRYAFLRGSILTPAVALRGTYSFTTGVDELDVTNAGLELSISKGFAFLTPYAGIGIIRTSGDPGSGVAQSDEDVNLEKAYVGININLGFNLGFEIDRTGEFTTFSGKAGIRF